MSPIAGKVRLLTIFFFILCLWIGVAVYMDIEEKFLLDKVVVRYMIYFGWLLLVALSGCYAWRGHQKKWMVSFWVTVYGIAGTVLLLSGITDAFIYPFGVTVKMYLQSFRLFFLSPIPFVLLYLFSKLGEKSSC